VTQANSLLGAKRCVKDLFAEFVNFDVLFQGTEVIILFLLKPSASVSLWCRIRGGG